MAPVMLVMPEPIRPHRIRPFAVMPQTAEATGPPGEDRDRRDDARQASRLRLIERELTEVQRRLDRILATIRADTIAPLPQVYDDGEGSER
jgi:hypothetical protein